MLYFLIVMFTVSGVAFAGSSIGSETHHRTYEIISLSGVMGVSKQVRHQAEVVTEVHTEGTANSFQKRRLLMSLSGWSQPALAARFEQVLNIYTDEEQRALLALLQNPLMARLRYAEETALLEQNTQSYHDYLARLERNPPGHARAQRIKKLAQSMQMERWITKANEAVSVGASVALNRAVNGAALADTSSRAIRYFLFYAHRRISNPEMDQLVRLWSDPLMQRWLNDAFQALPNTMSFELSTATID